ncbi:DUF2799 domain-containing protein [Undibacterium sp. TJN19]|uniref:DUF2799 domain-containing protein n=1 Tax=Undibacterium sp. TJN19 TaxID=3413055 RepID=UPI003BEFCCB8
MRIRIQQVRTIISLITITSAIAASSILLSGCQSTMTRVNDCKVGDWVSIGTKDGAEGLDKRFDDRRRFCSLVDGDKIKAESSANYDQGWLLGNYQYWSSLGREDGRAARAISYFESQSKSQTTQRNHTPLNHHAYEQGWQQGNADYWYQTGMQDGKAARNAGEEESRAKAGAAIGFQLAAYQHGWRDGNYAYWEQTGYQDAHDGIPDLELQGRAKKAASAGLLVREDAYHTGWSREIVEYWKNLGWNDAVSGRDIHTRRDDAQKRGLKIFETEYQKKWEQRLQQYWQDMGNKDGYGYPDQLEQRMANARRDNVFVIAQTRALYQQAWANQNARYCTVENAFNWGRQNQAMAVEVCNAGMQNQLRRALLGGQDYENLARRQRDAHNDLLVNNDRYEDAERKLRRLEQEIKRDQDDKNRPKNEDTANIDKRREREHHDLHDIMNNVRRKIDELKTWEFRYEQQMQQIKRDLYLN